MASRPEILLIRAFRNVPGDLGIKDRPAMPEIEDAIAATKAFLESYLEQPLLRGKSPTRAQLFGEDGRVIADFRLTPTGADPVLTTGQ